MPPLRLVQNFRGFRAHLATSDLRQVENLEASLARLGLTVAHVDPLQGDRTPDMASLRHDRDVLFIDGDLEPQPWAAPDPIGTLLQAPVIGLVGVEAPSRLKALLSVGATAFLRKPVHGSTVYSALFMGVNEFLRRRHLEIRLQEHERRRWGRRFVIRAVMILTRDGAMDEDRAYETLRRESMKQRLSLEDYCERFVGGGASIPSAETGGLPPGRAAQSK
ncbi:ANTAR domain-containing response regulator [Arenibaculum pallidiluteum]|uniref:ANTAR domain-containing response regulator n=1 Tax=Arenibaculum pallidiluteum TaxID=2812559 RepID=UPI001A971718|nr:ANTAR domain-containing protein [Arenibaculum pallidiluteum]